MLVLCHIYNHIAEINQLIDKGVLSMLPPAETPSPPIIPAKLFLKAKKNADGSIKKIKGRLVAGGHEQVHGADDDYSSPTVSTEAMLTVVAVSAAKGHKLSKIQHVPVLFAFK
jgi:hypothetical protein